MLTLLPDDENANMNEQNGCLDENVIGNGVGNLFMIGSIVLLKVNYRSLLPLKMKTRARHPGGVHAPSGTWHLVPLHLSWGTLKS